MSIYIPKHRTKIVCTIGLASRDEKTLEKLIRSGMNVARLNFAHGTLSQHKETVKRIRKVAKRLDRVVAVLADLPGPKIRIGRLQKEPVALKPNESIILDTSISESSGEDKIIPCQFKQLAKYVKKGDEIFLNDGFIKLVVKTVKENQIDCRVLVGGFLHSFKGMNLPHVELKTEAVTEQDLKYLEFGLKQDIDAFSVSFVKDANDIKKVKRFAAKRNKNIFVVAKIERSVALKNANEILAEADAVMVARGDLGVEIPIETVPAEQKKLILECNMLGKPVITATQMLESMTANVRPTRAEVTDVANAILDGTDAVMLSAETASGAFPVDAVKMMSKIAAETEKQQAYRESAFYLRQEWRDTFKASVPEIKDSISYGAADGVVRLGVKYILTPTETGATAMRTASFRPACWVIAFTPHLHVKRNLAFMSGVCPIQIKRPSNLWDATVLAYVRKHKLVKKNDRVIIMERLHLGQHTGTNSLKVITAE